MFWKDFKVHKLHKINNSDITSFFARTVLQGLGTKTWKRTWKGEISLKMCVLNKGKITVFSYSNIGYESSMDWDFNSFI